MTEIFFKEECYAIQGAIYGVYREMGCGFLESVYQECLEIEFKSRNIPFFSQEKLDLFYKGELLKQAYKPDFVCYSEIVVELKALNQTVGEHQAQVLNYLKGANKKLGLLVNFGAYPKATIERFAL